MAWFVIPEDCLDCLPNEDLNTEYKDAAIQDACPGGQTVPRSARHCHNQYTHVENLHRFLGASGILRRAEQEMKGILSAFPSLEISKHCCDIERMLVMIHIAETLQVQRLSDDQQMESLVKAAVRDLLKKNEQTAVVLPNYCCQAFNMNGNICLMFGVSDDGTIPGTPLLKLKRCMKQLLDKIGGELVLPGFSPEFVRVCIQARNVVIPPTRCHSIPNPERYFRRYAADARKALGRFLRWFRFDYEKRHEQQTCMVSLVVFSRNARHMPAVMDFVFLVRNNRPSVQYLQCPVPPKDVERLIALEYSKKFQPEDFTMDKLNADRTKPVQGMYWIMKARNYHYDILKRRIRDERRARPCPLLKWKQKQRETPISRIQRLKNWWHIFHRFGYTWGVSIFDIKFRQGFGQNKLTAHGVATFRGAGYSRTMVEEKSRDGTVRRHPTRTTIF